MATTIIVENELGIFLDVIAFDATPTEQHDSIAVVTEFPVEEGADVADHIRVLPKALSCEVFVSNEPLHPFTFLGPLLALRGAEQTVPLDLPQPFNPPALFRGLTLASPGAGIRTALAAIEGRLTKPAAFATVLKFDPPFDAVAVTYAKLMAIQESKAKLRVVTTLTEYSDMALLAVSTPRTVANGTGATFQLGFRQLRKVSPATVAAPKVPLEPRGAPKRNRGGQGATAVDDEAAKKARKSLLLKGAEALVSGFENLALGG
jgi:Dit-like tail protein